MTARLLIFVQHLRGIGHLQRAATLARALAADGFIVDLVSGGMPVPEIDLSGIGLHQLPALRSPDDRYNRLVDAQGRNATPALHLERCEMLKKILDKTRPDAVVVEMFPFGRSQIKGEMVALVEAARTASPRPLLISSVRDIIPAKRTASRYEEMADQVAAWFDAVLVHGDEAIIPFEASFPPATRIGGWLHYTGYVLPDPFPAPSEAAAPAEVLVSAGGGAFGAKLLEAAIAARNNPILDREIADAPWRLLTGPNIPRRHAAGIKRLAGDGVVIERMRPDFQALLAGARVSISQCGYNTSMEVIASGIPAVIVPFGSGRQTEQHSRAAALSEIGLVESVPEKDLNGDSLATAINAAVKMGPRRSGDIKIDMSGALMTCRLMRQWLSQGQAVSAAALGPPG